MPPIPPPTPPAVRPAWTAQATGGLLGVAGSAPLAGIGSIAIAFATDQFSSDSYDSGNRAAGFFFAILVTFAVGILGVVIFGAVWGTWHRTRAAVFAGLTPAVAALVVVPLLWNR